MNLKQICHIPRQMSEIPDNDHKIGRGEEIEFRSGEGDHNILNRR